MLPAPTGPSWEKLQTHLGLLEDFGLLVLIFPSAGQAERWRAALAAQYAEKQRTLAVLGPFDAASVGGLANALLEFHPEANTAALWLPLYHAASAADAEEWPAALARGLAGLNHVRNLLPQRLRLPLLLCGTHELLATAPDLAPDLWSIRRAFIKVESTHLGDLPFDQGDIQSAVLRGPAEDAPDFRRALAGAEQLRDQPEKVAQRLTLLARAAYGANQSGEHALAGKILDQAVEVAGLPTPAEALEQKSVPLGLLAEILRQYSRTGEALRLAEESLVMREKAFAEPGDSSPHAADGVIAALVQIALILGDLGNNVDAETYLRRAVSLSQQKDFSNQKLAYYAVLNLTNLLKRTRRFADALKISELNLALAEKTSGRGSNEVADALAIHAEIMGDLGQTREAERYAREALHRIGEGQGDKSRRLAAGMIVLASILYKQERFTEVEALYREAIDLLEKVFGPEHPDITDSLVRLAVVLAHNDQFLEAEDLIARAVKIRQQSFGERDPRAAVPTELLAVIREAQGRIDEALSLEEYAFEIYKEKLGQDHEMTMRTKKMVELLKKKLTESP